MFYEPPPPPQFFILFLLHLDEASCKFIAIRIKRNKKGKFEITYIIPRLMLYVCDNFPSLYASEKLIVNRIQANKSEVNDKGYKLK